MITVADKNVGDDEDDDDGDNRMMGRTKYAIYNERGEEKKSWERDRGGLYI